MSPKPMVVLLGVFVLASSFSSADYPVHCHILKPDKTKDGFKGFNECYIGSNTGFGPLNCGTSQKSIYIKGGTKVKHLAIGVVHKSSTISKFMDIKDAHTGISEYPSTIDYRNENSHRSHSDMMKGIFGGGNEDPEMDVAIDDVYKAYREASAHAVNPKNGLRPKGQLHNGINPKTDAYVLTDLEIDKNEPLFRSCEAAANADSSEAGTSGEKPNLKPQTNGGAH